MHYGDNWHKIRTHSAETTMISQICLRLLQGKCTTCQWARTSCPILNWRRFLALQENDIVSEVHIIFVNILNHNNIFQLVLIFPITFPLRAESRRLSKVFRTKWRPSVDVNCRRKFDVNRTTPNKNIHEKQLDFYGKQRFKLAAATITNKMLLKFY